MKLINFKRNKNIMNRDFLKYFIFILIILFMCSGCKQNNIIITNSFSILQNDPEAVKYKNGIILVKSNKQYNMKNRKKINTMEFGSGNIKFGPKDINFEN